MTIDLSDPIVYRVMLPDEHPQARVSGIWARNPARRVHPQRHVSHGTVESDNWISTTRNMLWAISWQIADQVPIYVIDLRGVQATILDLTIPVNTSGWHPRYRQLALRAAEVLVDTYIPADAIVGTIP